MAAHGEIRISEIFYSLQGESSFSGLPTVFIRLTGCPLRCGYCDTAYAFSGGEWKTIDVILERVKSYGAQYVCVTGGEPLAQKSCLDLLQALCDAGYSVSLETSGAMDICDVDARVVRVMDIKTPGSGEAAKNLFSNIDCLSAQDEVKFVICSVEDYEWMKSTITEHALAAKCELLASWVHPLGADQSDPSLKPFPADHHPIHRRELVERIVTDALPVRFQIQMHKGVWPPEERGV